MRLPVILDARPGPVDAWPRGAHRAELDRDLSAPADPAVGGRHPLPPLSAWCATLGRWGIGPDTDVIVVDDQGGGLAAARAWWMLRAVGHTRVRVAELSDEAGLTNLPTPPSDGPPYPATAWTLPIATAEDVERRRLDPAWRVLDARSAARFRGEGETLDPPGGRIPGAINLPWAEAIDLREARERLAAALGDVPAARVIATCGSGVTACHTLLQMDRLGLGIGALYVGSYSEWCRQGRPVERG